jgi:hypothetical protein
VRAKRGLFQPHLHPEVASVQLQLAQQLTVAAGRCVKGSATQKVRFASSGRRNMFSTVAFLQAITTEANALLSEVVRAR